MSKRKNARADDKYLAMGWAFIEGRWSTVWGTANGRVCLGVTGRRYGRRVISKGRITIYPDRDYGSAAIVGDFVEVAVATTPAEAAKVLAARTVTHA